jgi:hypothetical protein
VLRVIALDRDRGEVLPVDLDRIGATEREHEVDRGRDAGLDGDLRDLDRLAGERRDDVVAARPQMIDVVHAIVVRGDRAHRAFTADADLGLRDRIAAVTIADEAHDGAGGVARLLLPRAARREQRDNYE